MHTFFSGLSEFKLNCNMDGEIAMVRFQKFHTHSKDGIGSRGVVRGFKPENHPLGRYGYLSEPHIQYSSFSCLKSPKVAIFFLPILRKSPKFALNRQKSP